MTSVIWKTKFSLFAYVAFLQFELIAIRNLSDLAPATSNWVEKATQILSFQVPTNNFY